MINIFLLDLATFVRLILIRIFILVFLCPSIYCYFMQSIFRIRATNAVFYANTFASTLAYLRCMRFMCDTCVSWSSRNYKPQAKSAWIRTAMDYCALIRQNKLQVCIIHGSRASYGVLFLSRRSQSVQFNATVLKRMVSTF